LQIQSMHFKQVEGALADATLQANLRKFQSRGSPRFAAKAVAELAQSSSER